MELEKLKVPLPKEAISKHPTKTYLSTIKAIYVTERFNEVFGVGKWTLKVDHVTTQPKAANSKVGDMVVVKTTFEVPEKGIYYESYGGNDNLDLGDAYKGATTDAITKIGSYLGVGIDVFKGNPNVEAKPNITDYQFVDAVKKMLANGTIKVGTPDQTVMDFLEMKFTVSQAYKARITPEINKQALNIK